MDENERIVCEFLREIAPSREWRYLCEVEHCLIGELCDELNKQLNAENAKLRELVRELWEGYADPPCEDCPFRDTPTCADCPICAREASVIDRMRELGVDA